ncbi:MAG TPA: hypothetical protein VH397_00130 [Xanthobacteraceae bacterium]
MLDALHDARLFRLLLPRSCDGEEVEPGTLFQVVEAIAQGDASVAWCIGQASGVSMTAAYVKPEVAHTVFGDKRAVAARGPNNPKALAVICNGGYRATGQWGFASGCRHAAWILGHCTVCESDGTPRLGPDGNPLPLRSMIFPKSAAAMNDDWNVIGLKGTGSVSYSVKDLFVPDDFTFTRDTDADRREAGPLYRFSMFNMFGVGFSGAALGIARRALDDFIKLAMTKKPYAATTLLAHNNQIQSQVGLSEARLQSSRIYVIETFRKLYEAVEQGLRFNQQMRIRAIAARRRRRGARRRRLARRRGRDPDERKLPVVGGLASSDQLADGLLAHSQPVRDRPVAHPLALEHLDAAQTFTGDPPATAAPTRRATEPRHPALRIAPLVPPYAALRSGKRLRHLRLLGKARLRQEHHRIGLGHRILSAIVMHR